MTDTRNNDWISKTVYSLEWPEVKDLRDKMWKNDRTDLHRLTAHAWTKTQDRIHQDFFDTWFEWTHGKITINRNDFFAYPTNGSSEAIRDTICEIAAKNTSATDDTVIWTFEGEYEGYRAYAETYGVKVFTIKRERFEEYYNNPYENLTREEKRKQVPVPDPCTNIRDKDVFFLSNPSSIDGNWWSYYNAFMEYMKDKKPNTKIMLDLCYLGCTKEVPYPLFLNYPNISKIFFSLSKVYGVYYDRIGGVLSKDEMPGLYGNIWFKNVHSLDFGTRLMMNYPMGYFPKKYENQQKIVLRKLHEMSNNIESMGIPGFTSKYVHSNVLHCSDVVLLGYVKDRDIFDTIPPYTDAFSEHFARGAGIRICLTPMMDRRINSFWRDTHETNRLR